MLQKATQSICAIFSKKSDDFAIVFLLFGDKMLVVKIKYMQYGAYGSIGESGSIGENPT